MPAPSTAVRLTQELRRELSAVSLSGPIAGLAFRTAVASVLAMLAAMALHLDAPYWAAITAVSIIQPDVASSLGRSLDRCLGTVAGAAVGYFGAGLAGEHLLFQIVVGGAVVFGIYGAERASHGYAALLAAVTVVLVMFGSLDAPDDALRIAVYRSLEIMVGVAAAYGVESALAPSAARPAVAPKPGIFARPIDQALLATALTGAVAIALIPIVWNALALPGLGQTPITAFVILSAMRREPTWTAANRLAGCVLGGVYGLVSMRFAGDDMGMWLALLFAGLYVSCHVKNGAGEAGYSGHQAAVAILLSMVQGLAPSPDILPAIDRFVGIVGGGVVVVAAQAFVSPWVERAVARLSN